MGKKKLGELWGLLEIKFGDMMLMLLMVIYLPVDSHSLREKEHFPSDLYICD